MTLLGPATHNERVKFHYKLTNEAFIFRQLKKAGEGAY